MRCCLLVILSVVVGAKSAPVTDDKAHSYPPTYKGPIIGMQGVERMLHEFTSI